jgi:hypothetical protein
MSTIARSAGLVAAITAGALATALLHGPGPAHPVPGSAQLRPAEFVIAAAPALPKDPYVITLPHRRPA